MELRLPPKNKTCPNPKANFRAKIGMTFRRKNWGGFLGKYWSGFGEFLGDKVGAISGGEKQANFWSEIGADFGVIFWRFWRGVKKVSAESFKKESAVCRNEKRSLLKKKAQLFLHNF